MSTSPAQPPAPIPAPQREMHPAMRAADLLRANLYKIHQDAQAAGASSGGSLAASERSWRRDVASVIEQAYASREKKLTDALKVIRLLIQWDAIAPTQGEPDLVQRVKNWLKENDEPKA